MKRKLVVWISFILIVLLPTIYSVYYFFFLATPTYISESKIIVKTIGIEQSYVGIDSLLRSLGALEPSSVATYAVEEYILSRTAMYNLDKQFQIKNYFKDKKWDIFRRFDSFNLNDSYENFFDYYTDFVVNVSVDPQSLVLTIRNRCADPDYCYKVNSELIRISENFINQLNKRSSMTALNYFKNKLEENRKKIKQFSKKIQEFLNRTKVVSPEQQIGALIQMVSSMEEKLIEKQIEVSNLQITTPNNPKIKELKQEIKLIKAEIKKYLDEIAGKKEAVGPQSIKLELMKTELDTLYKELEANLNAFIQAQNQALLQQLFIERIEEPNIPDAPVEPEPIKGIFVIFVVSFFIWGILILTVSAIREHIGS